MAAELGRQPWLVYGLLRTARRAPRRTVSAGQDVSSPLLGFMGLYAAAGRALSVPACVVRGKIDEADPNRVSGVRRRTMMKHALVRSSWSSDARRSMPSSTASISASASLHLLRRRGPDEERGPSLDAIGPVWNGNEVWLIASGGAMVVAFPGLYATAFSGFYLALMIVLWLLSCAGIGIEFRHQIDDPLWRRRVGRHVFAVAERAARAAVRGRARQRAARRAARRRRRIPRLVCVDAEPVRDPWGAAGGRHACPARRVMGGNESRR